jgi:hypothetical protein
MKTKIKKYKKLRCAANTKKKKYSCFSDKSLYKLKNYWNKKHPNLKISTGNSYEVWRELKQNLENVCDSELCWLKQDFINNNLDKNMLDYTFAPKSPDSWKVNKNTWLSSIDITKVMKQYENKYKNFAFIGPSPIDFDSSINKNSCVWDELCKFNLNNFIKNNKTKIGLIFNTDPHYKNGSHWVCMMIDIEKKIIYYFDSVGDKPQKEIIKLVDKIKYQGKKLRINFEYKENYPFQHQEGNTECGMYVLYFITSIVENKKNFNYFTSNKIKDIQMEKFRKIFYN